jgi:hypothetical protein
VSLNNRIYYRDRPYAAAIVDSEHAVSADQSRRFAITSQFSQGNIPTNTKTADEGFKLHSIPNSIGLGESKGDEASIGSDPRRVRSILIVIRYF